jgi:hypothetical protein
VVDSHPGSGSFKPGNDKTDSKDTKAADSTSKDTLKHK